MKKEVYKKDAGIREIDYLNPVRIEKALLLIYNDLNEITDITTLNSDGEETSIYIDSKAQPLKEVHYINNGEYTIKPDLNYTSIKKVNVKIDTSVDWGEIGGTLSEQTDLQGALDGKVGKVSTASKVYGTDADGNQVTYDKDEVGAPIDDTTTSTTKVWSSSKVSTALAGKADLSHSHSMSEVNGLGTALSGLQNKNDSNLQTSNQSIVGAINEVRGSVLGLASQLTDIIHAYTIDFQTGRTIVQERNLHGSVKLTKIVTDNVASLHLSINGTAQTIALSSGTWNGNIAIADNDLLAWSISRSTEGSIAEINIKYEYNS